VRPLPKCERHPRKHRFTIKGQGVKGTLLISRLPRPLRSHSSCLRITSLAIPTFSSLCEMNSLQESAEPAVDTTGVGRLGSPAKGELKRKFRTTIGCSALA
jgi:hypothetical protein